MRRLVEHQPVAVELDREGHIVDCAVGSVCGAVATVAPIAELSPDLQETLTPGALCLLVFEFRGSPIALRGVARAIYGGAALEFVVIDGIQMWDRRTAPRVQMHTPVRAAPAASRSASAPAIDTVTVNLSMCGALLKRRPGLDRGPWQIELSLPDDGTPVSCSAMFVRQTRRHLAIKFGEIPDADLVRLAGAIADHEHLSWP